MKKILILILSVIILSVTGCGKADVNNANTVAKMELDETSSEVATEKISDIHQTETVDKKDESTSESKVETEVTPTPQVAETNKKEEVQTTPKVESQQEPKAETPVKEVQAEKVAEQPAQLPKEEKPSIKSYDPNEVVKIATNKTKKAGKTLLTDNLDNLLANGTITKAEYDEYYPYDGAGYYSVFVETDLNTATTIGGESLSSVEAIASYVADMMVLESGDLFLIEYAGTIDHHGTPLYEFRCYRA